MAGAGYRSFAPNTVLTADQVQNFLMDQAVQVYADASERDTTLTGVVSEGMVAYLEDSNSVTVYDGSQWIGLGGDAPIFTQGAAGAILVSDGNEADWSSAGTSGGVIYSTGSGVAFSPAGTAGQFLTTDGTDVSWADIEEPDDATPTDTGLVPGYVVLKDGASPPNNEEFSNFGIGWKVLQNLTPGTAPSSPYKNTVLGYKSGNSLTNGNRNTALGHSALESGTVSSRNTAIGMEALQNTTGSDNTGVGSASLFGISTGSNNTGVGGGAIGANGDDNTAVGSSAMAFMSNGADNNTSVGFQSLFYVSGSNNTAIGHQAGRNNPLSGNNNSLIGHAALASSNSVSNEITLGDSNITTLRCATGSITTFSDRRDKKNIENLDLGLNLIKELKPVKFDWEMRDGGKTDQPDAGFIAQDVIEAEDKFQAHDYLKLSMRSNEDRYEISPSRLIPVLVNAIQELSAEVDSLKAQLSEK